MKDDMVTVPCIERRDDRAHEACADDSNAIGVLHSLPSLSEPHSGWLRCVWPVRPSKCDPRMQRRGYRQLERARQAITGFSPSCSIV